MVEITYIVIIQMVCRRVFWIEKVSLAIETKMPNNHTQLRGLLYKKGETLEGTV